jgi:hypothetical protein
VLTLLFKTSLAEKIQLVVNRDYSNDSDDEKVSHGSEERDECVDKKSDKDEQGN